jgi:hypothetical protein
MIRMTYTTIIAKVPFREERKRKMRRGRVRKKSEQGKTFCLREVKLVHITRRRICGTAKFANSRVRDLNSGERKKRERNSC